MQSKHSLHWGRTALVHTPWEEWLQVDCFEAKDPSPNLHQNQPEESVDKYMDDPPMDRKK